jgi:hypothetical protein
MAIGGMRHEVFAVRHIAEEALEEYATGRLSP